MPCLARGTGRAGRWRAALVLLLALFAGSARAEGDGAVQLGPGPQPIAQRDRHIYRISLLVDGAITTVLGLGYLVPLKLEYRIIDRTCPCDPAEVPSFERWAVGLTSFPAEIAADVTYALALAVPPIATLATLGFSRAFLEDGMVFLETLAANAGIMAIAKNLLQRPVPAAYAGDRSTFDVPASYRSFYSGHVATVVASLTATAWTLRFRYGEMVWPWVVMAVAGASVGAELVISGGHFPSDCVVGALAGFAIGTVVPFLHRRPVAETRVSLFPMRRGVGIALRF